MKNRIFGYIEHSLYNQNFVIIPNLGGFIVNIESDECPVEIKSPIFKIVFNPDLNHDDGVLASYIMKDENVSYKVASQQIKDFVKDLKNTLTNQESMSFNFGSISFDGNNNIVFSGNKNAIFPAFYGLTPVKLTYLSDISGLSNKTKRNLLYRNMIGAVAAIGIGMYLFALPSTSIQDRVDTQSAGFINLLTTTRVSSPVELKVTLDTTSVVNDTQIALRTYYVIVGGEESSSRAEKLLTKVQSAGFNNAAIVQSDGRYRIYIASFEDKTEGESFLETFRQENPGYRSAWLYSKRNK